MGKTKFALFVNVSEIAQKSQASFRECQKVYGKVGGVGFQAGKRAGQLENGTPDVHISPRSLVLAAPNIYGQSIKEF